ncbi:GH1 family beta-glucosidase [Roseateles saccharophilus]|uniref:Beta-glucosidase n=1 Tax=Roseateles saccharophilus TaxID=304 RepID=A0A4R3URT3_ROSSA|nr:GH1 family beta-glucosidase [Roseateles saccharophilus]MDG0833696.1 beta-glucosidase [Roseateles saccharophilus]TCU93283.1 beta-glucosidase [Roseateles saccharophilus]
MDLTPPPTLAELVSPPAGSAMRRRDFIFGAGTSSYQIEGAARADSRLESIWDRFCATPGKVLRGETGAVACDHYHRWREDLDILARLGVDAYRFSIAWPRVMDEAGRPNHRGIDFYKRLLGGLAERGIRAFVTLYHWDLPQHLQDRDGWLNRGTAWRFADYADLMSRALAGHGDVAAWTTHNEPWCSAYLGYGDGHHAPGLKSPRWAAQAMHHLLLGHGLALPALRANAPRAQHGIVANVAPGYADSDTAADRDAAHLFETFQNRWVLDPLLKGEYPADLWRYWKGCEPAMQPGDMDIIQRPIDYLGLNFYSRALLRSAGPDTMAWVRRPDVERTTMDWEVYPQGMQDLLEALDREYVRLPPLYITENGMSSHDAISRGEVDDVQRQAYIKRHFAACSRAMENGVDVRGYFIWSLLDNFEWAFGYERRFGLVHVDFDTQKRTLKRSALAYADFLRERAAG